MAQDKGLYNLLIDLRANVSTLQTDMNKAVGILERSGRTMSGVVQGIFQGVGQALGREVLGSISRVSTALEDLASKGNRAGAILENFQKLGGSASGIEQAKKAILGTVDAFELMRVANEGLAKGIPNLNQNFAKLTEFANKFADATGQDTAQVLNQLIAALGTGAPKALQAFGFQLDEGANKAQNQAAVYDQLLGKLQQFAPLGESVSQGQERLNAAMSEAISTIGIAINDNQELAKVYNHLAQEIEKIDWKQVGSDIASMVSTIVSMLPSLQSVANAVSNIALNLRYYTGNLTPMEQNLKKIADLQGELAKVQELGKNKFANWLLDGAYQKREEELKTQLENAKRAARNMMDADGLQNFLNSSPVPSTSTGNQNSPQPPKPNGGGSGSSALDKLKSDWKKFTEQDVRRGLSEAIGNLDRSGFQALRDKLQQQLEDAYVESNRKFVDAKLISMDELLVRAKAHAAEEVAEYEKKMDQVLTDRFADERKNAEDIAEIQRRAAEEAARIHANAVNSWQRFYDRMFSGQGFDPEQSLKEIASGFLSELSASFFGELKGNADTFVGLGQLIAAGFGQGVGKMFGTAGNTSGGSSGGLGGIINSIGGIFQSSMSTEQAHAAGIQGPGMADGSFGGGSILGNAGSMFQGSMSTEQAHAAGIQGPGMADGSFGGGPGYGSAGVATLIQFGTSAFAAKDADKRNKDNSGTGAAAGTAVGAGIGAIFGGPIGIPIGMMIGAQIGQVAGSVIGGMIKRGPQNKETQARRGFAHWMEDRLQGMGGLTILDQNNENPRNFTDFMEGSTTRFNKKGWADEFNQQAGKAAKTFTGLGTALKEVLGITEDVGAQIGAMLGENLNFNINNARHLVKRLGLSFEDLQEKLVELGRQGKKTWLEVETEIQGVSEAFKPGLVEVGAVGKAFDNVINSGAKGFFAIQSLRDIAEEAIEAQIVDLDQLKEHLLKTYDPETVEKFFQALDKRGIKTIEQLRGLSDRDAGGVIADMQALGVDFKEVGKEISDGTQELGEVTKSAAQNVKEATDAMRDLTSELTKRGTKMLRSGEPSDDDVEAAYATGGIVARPTKALMGEAGPEAILPLARKNGKLGVHVAGGYGGGSGMIIQIDARGATPGMEARIRSAMKESEDRAVRRMVRSLQSSGRM